MISRKTLKGTVLTEGIAFGNVCLYQEDILESAPKSGIPEERVVEEKERLLRAIENTKKELHEVYDRVSKSLSATEAEVFLAHIMIVEDFSFISQIEQCIADRLVNAECAVLETVKSYEKRLNSLPNDYLRERTQDIDDIARRLLKNLGVKHTGFMCACPKGEPAIVAAQDLTPSLIANLEERKVAGLVTERGSTISHGAILARAMGVPAMIEVDNLISNIGCGMNLLIDGYKGHLHINPDSKTVSNYRRKSAKRIPHRRKYALGYAVTKDGVRVRLSANAGNIKDVHNAQQRGIRDIGLFRTEFFFLGRESEPSIAEQVRIYKKIVNSTDGTVTFRLLDIGGDKILDYLSLPRQDNPNLGLRGVRIYDRYPDTMANQVEALLIARGKNSMRMMIPMISTLEEFRSIKRKIYDTLGRLKKKEIAESDSLKVGCMIEVPAAVYLIQDLADEADFLSIGTNDLIQYVMGVDRSNRHLVELCDPLQPAVLKVLSDIIQKTGQSGKEVSVCGEIAGYPEMAKILVGLGYRFLSMNPYNIEKVGDTISKYTLRDLQKDAAEVLKTKTLVKAKQTVLKGSDRS